MKRGVVADMILHHWSAGDLKALYWDGYHTEILDKYADIVSRRGDDELLTKALEIADKFIEELKDQEITGE